MRKMRKVVKIAVTLILTLSMVLGSYVGVFAKPPQPPQPPGIQNDSYNIVIGDERTLHTEHDSGYTVSWSTSNSSIVSVGSTTGVIKGLYLTGLSYVTITATFTKPGFPTVTDTCRVYVNERSGGYEHFHVDKTAMLTVTLQKNGVDQGVTAIPAWVTNLTVTVDGIPMSVHEISDQWAVSLTDRDHNSTLAVISITYRLVSKTDPNVYFDFSKTFTQAELIQAVLNCPTINGFDVALSGTATINVNYYTATFVGHDGVYIVTDVESGDSISTGVGTQPIDQSTYNENVGDVLTVYTFLGWDDDGTQEQEYFTTTEAQAILLTADRTFTAIYNPVNYYTATFIGEDGTYIVTNVQSGAAISTGLGTQPVDQINYTVFGTGVRTVFDFLGWDDQSTAEVENYSTSEAQEITLTTNKAFDAVYSQTVYYTVSFYDDDGITFLGSTEENSGANITEGNIPTGLTKDEDTSTVGVRIVYDFIGWDDMGTLAVEEFTAMQVAAMAVTSPMNFKAVYSPTRFFTINFYEEDGITFIDSREVQEGGDLSDFPSAPTKPDSPDGLNYYNFDQWVTLGGDIVSFEGIRGTFDVKAQYTENEYVVVDFYVELPDGTTILIDTQYLLPGGNALDPGPGWMEENDYILGDWDGSLTGIEVDTILTASAATVAGEQEENRLTVRFYVQLPDGTKILIDTQSVLYGDDAKDPAADWMAVNNYILGSWDGSLSDIMKDTDFIARAANVAGATEVQTGDTVPIVSMSILLAAAAFSIVFVTSKKRKDA